MPDLVSNVAPKGFDAITAVFDYRRKHGIITAADGSAKQTTEQQQEIRNLLNLGEQKMETANVIEPLGFAEVFGEVKIAEAKDYAEKAKVYGEACTKYNNEAKIYENADAKFYPDENLAEIPAKILEKFQDRFTDLTEYVVLAEHEGAAVVATVVQSKRNQYDTVFEHVCIAAEPAKTKTGEIKKGDFITVPADSIYNAILVSELF